jgi:MSHA pilin protein MshD
MRTRQHGVTLVELVVAITIVAVAASAVLGALAAVASRSADAMVEQQAVSIAQAYLEEISQRWVVDPNGSPPNTGRSSWDTVDQYNGLVDNGATDQFGNAISGLGAYTVKVAVVSSSALAGITSANARRVDITVVHPSGINVTLTGYRTNY